MNENLTFAIKLLENNEFDKGIDILEEILGENPKDKDALYNLALAFNSINKPEKSIKTFEFYLKNYEKDGSVLAGLGFSYFLNNEIEKAKSMLEEAVKIEPKNIYALRNLGGVYAELNEYEKAVKIFENILLIDTTDYKALFGLGLIFFKKEDYSKAENYFYQIMALPITDKEKTPSKTYLTKIAEKTLKSKGLRFDAVMYLISAINTYKTLDNASIQKITYEIGLMGQRGLDINNPDKKYKIGSLNGREMTGLCAVCYMYTGFQMLDSSQDVGIDLSMEYEQAEKLLKSGVF